MNLEFCMLQWLSHLASWHTQNLYADVTRSMLLGGPASLAAGPQLVCVGMPWEQQTSSQGSVSALCWWVGFVLWIWGVPSWNWKRARQDLLGVEPTQQLLGTRCSLCIPDRDELPHWRDPSCTTHDCLLSWLEHLTHWRSWMRPSQGRNTWTPLLSWTPKIPDKICRPQHCLVKCYWNLWWIFLRRSGVMGSHSECEHSESFPWMPFRRYTSLRKEQWGVKKASRNLVKWRALDGANCPPAYGHWHECSELTEVVWCLFQQDPQYYQ